MNVRKGWSGIYFNLCLIALIIILGFTMGYKNVVIKVDGQEISSITAKRTVGELLEYKGIDLGSHDYISEDLNAPITSDMTVEIERAEITQSESIEIKRIVQKTEIVNETVEYETEYQEDPNIDKGVTKVIKEGKNGERELTYTITLVDGQEFERTLTEEKVLSEPINRLVAKGIRDRVSIGSVSRSYNTSMTMVATAYTHTGNPTYTGVMPKRGTVAVDPSIIPLGREIFIEGYGLAIAQDIGSSIKGNRIDVFVDTKEEARTWGRKTVRVYLLD